MARKKMNYRVSLWHETGGYINILASSAEEAKKKANRLLDEKGEEAIKDVTHRDYYAMDVELDKSEPIGLNADTVPHIVEEWEAATA